MYIFLNALALFLFIGIHCLTEAWDCMGNGQNFQLRITLSIQLSTLKLNRLCNLLSKLLLIEGSLLGKILR